MLTQHWGGAAKATDLSPNASVIAGPKKYHRIGNIRNSKFYAAKCSGYQYSWDKLTTVGEAEALGKTYCRICATRNTD